MRKVLAVISFVAIFALALAINPAAELGRLRDCDSMRIGQKGKDIIPIMGKSQVRELLEFISVDTNAARDTITGQALFTVAFFRGDNKVATNTLYFNTTGVWGFAKLKGKYGVSRDALKWLTDAIGK